MNKCRNNKLYTVYELYFLNLLWIFFSFSFRFYHNIIVVYTINFLTFYRFCQIEITHKRVFPFPLYRTYTIDAKHKRIEIFFKKLLSSIFQRICREEVTECVGISMWNTSSSFLSTICLNKTDFVNRTDVFTLSGWEFYHYHYSF